uniref:SMP-30/Gluconolactonase/LRE-like region domain-containing protein n=1 Tax=Timema poppense TaxID=170557 RepID=A0A7R9D5F1_TIMPO|nr:unnamed protein product [Timema poppensis]
MFCYASLELLKVLAIMDIVGQLEDTRESSSFVIPIKGEPNKFLISTNRSLTILNWDGESDEPTSLQTIVTVEEDKPNNRFNDGKADPSGKVWAGTLGGEISPGVFAQKVAAFYSFKNPRSPVKHLSDVSMSNGLTWTRDLKTLYYIDTLKGQIEAFDNDPKAEKLSNGRVVVDFKKNCIPGNPDGLTIDTEGKLWVANFNGGQVLRVDATTGSVLRTLQIPANKVTCAVFGGADLDELYVTTANIRDTPEEREKFPLGGTTFRVTGLGVKGYAGDKAILDLE